MNDMRRLVQGHMIPVRAASLRTPSPAPLWKKSGPRKNGLRDALQHRLLASESRAELQAGATVQLKLDGLYQVESDSVPSTQSVSDILEQWCP